jgi:hypothetical protein
MHAVHRVADSNPCNRNISDLIPGHEDGRFSASAIDAAQEVMASQSRKSPLGAFTLLIIHLWSGFSFANSTAP